MEVFKRTLPGISSVTRADTCGLFTSGYLAYGGKDFAGSRRVADDKHPPFAGTVERVESQHVTRPLPPGRPEEERLRPVRWRKASAL